MNILIVDDEAPARSRLARLLNDDNAHQVVGEASNGEEALQCAQQLEPDVVLMDIRMPGMDGIEAARHLSLLDQPPAVIFTTAFADHALEAFATHAVDYLLKPVKKDRLVSALQAAARPTRAQASQQSEILSMVETRRHICARVRGDLVLVALEDIFYFQADQKYVTVRHREGEVLIEDSLKHLETEFADQFHRVHRNALVNVAELAGMHNDDHGHYIQFRDIEDQLEISRRHLPGVRKLIKNL